MWPLGHVAVAYLCYALPRRHRLGVPPGTLAALVLVAGSQFPDLVDKPLAWYAGVIPTGRSLAHSLLVLAVLAAALAWFARRHARGELAVAFATGAFSHTLVDALPAIWNAETSGAHLLWPITAVEPYESGAPSILELLQASLGDPYVLTEFLLAAAAFAAWRRDGYPGLEPVSGILERVRPTPN